MSAVYELSFIAYRSVEDDNLTYLALCRKNVEICAQKVNGAQKRTRPMLAAICISLFKKVSINIIIIKFMVYLIWGSR